MRRADRLPRAARWPATPSASASTGSARRRTSSPRSRATRAGGSSRSPARATQAAQAFARSLGADWAGGSDEPPPEPLDAALIFAPVGALVPARACARSTKGGTVVCAGIHMSDIPSFPYELLWGERTLRSVANLTRADGEEFLALAPKVPVRSEVTVFQLADANAALDALAEGRIRGAAVLVP